jgi:hypothetical protein
MEMLINIIAYGVVGGILASLGATISTWKFWLIMACLIAVQINSSLN